MRAAAKDITAGALVGCAVTEKNLLLKEKQNLGGRAAAWAVPSYALQRRTSPLARS
jgi:hypothetical protein